MRLNTRADRIYRTGITYSSSSADIGSHYESRAATFFFRYAARCADAGLIRARTRSRSCTEAEGKILAMLACTSRQAMSHGARQPLVATAT